MNPKEFKEKYVGETEYSSGHVERYVLLANIVPIPDDLQAYLNLEEAYWEDRKKPRMNREEWVKHNPDVVEGVEPLLLLEFINNEIVDSFYKWRGVNWGSRGTCDLEILEETEDSILFTVNSAWTPIIPALYNLSLKEEIKIEWEEIEEQIIPEWYSGGVLFDGKFIEAYILKDRCKEAELTVYEYLYKLAYNTTEVDEEYIRLLEEARKEPDGSE